MTTKYVKALDIGSTTQPVPLLDIPDGHGELKSVGVSNGLEYHYVKVTIDGVVLADDRLAGTAFPNGRCQASLSIGVRFEKSLLVEVRSSVPAPQARYWAVAQTDGSESAGSEYFTRDFDSVTIGFQRSTYRRADGSTYDVIVAVGPERVSEIDLQLDVYRQNELLQGRVRLRASSGEPLYEEFVPIVVRVSGTRRTFPIIGHFPGLEDDTRAFGVPNVAGSTAFRIPVETILGSLNFQLPMVVGFGPQLEIATQLERFSNVPTGFQLI